MFLFFSILINNDLSKDFRNKVLKELENEVPIGPGIKNIHLFPLYQKQIAYGKSFPWSINKKNIIIKRICPNAESLQEKCDDTNNRRL